MLKIMTMLEEVPTKEELEGFRQAEFERANGELKTYSVEELRKEFLND